MSWGIEFKESNRLTRINWKFYEHLGKEHVTIFGFYKLIFTFFIGLEGYMWIRFSDFYKIIVEQDFNREIDQSFHFVPFIACVHAFSLSKYYI